MARSDTHRPAEMIPGEYTYLAMSFGYPEENPETGHDMMITEWEGTEEWEAMGEPKQSTCAHARPYQCDHCGALHKYQVILRHLPTGDLLSVGHQCYAKRFSRRDWERVVADKARRAELAAQQAAKIRQAVAAMSEECRVAYEWGLTETANHIAQDIAGKVKQFGPLSEKQSAFLVKLHAEWIEKQRQVEDGECTPCPSGKMVITGTIVGIKEVVNDFGRTTKITVRDDRGFKVFGTLPAVIWNVLKDYRVTFSATIEPSQGDPTFGFYSRPTKASIIENTE